MASGPYDLGPFQTLSAINFAQGGIFGKILAIGAKSNRALYFPGTPLCSTFALVFPGETPDPTLSGYTTLTIQCLVGSFWEGHVNNPFDSVSEAPQDASDLYDATVSHDIDGGESFVPTVVGSVQCGADTNIANVQTATGQTFTPSGLFAPTEAFTFRGLNVGTEFELWACVFVYNDIGGWPSVPNTARFWAAATVNDKVTFT